MPDQCMFCWHPAQDWPDDINVAETMLSVPLCDWHMRACIKYCYQESLPEWWDDVRDQIQNVIDKAEELGQVIEAVHDEWHVLAKKAQSVWSDADDLPASIESHVKFNRRLCPERFDAWIQGRLVDLSRRNNADPRQGVHRCADSPCSNYVMNHGDVCGSRVCNGEKKLSHAGKPDYNLPAKDNVSRLLSVWSEVAR
jgi:hypothetical protein